MTLTELNSLTGLHAATEFGRCCASIRWARLMADARPFATEDVLFAKAERLWWSLEAADWLEAFAAHPRIGERATSAWSADEQQQAIATSDDVRDRLALGNREYERRFTYTFLVCATGKSAGELLLALERRLPGAPADELQVAAAEQRKIIILRIAKLLTP